MSFRVLSDMILVADVVVTVLVGMLAFVQRDIYVPEVASFAPTDPIADQIYRYFLLSVIVGLIFGYLTRITRQFSFIKLTRPLFRVVIDALGSWLMTLALVLGILFLTKSSGEFSRGWLVLFLAGNAISIGVLRAATLYGLRRAMRSGWLRRREIAIIGATSQASCLLNDVRNAGAADLFEVVGIFDDRVAGDRVGSTLDGVEVRGPVCGLLQRSTADLASIDIIAIAMPHSARDRIRQIKDYIQAIPANIVLAPDLAGALALPHQRALTLGESALIKIGHDPLQDWSGMLKWLEDKLIASLTIVLAAPLMLLIALAIRLDSRGPIFFRQTRFGFNNRPISVYKFRTMHHHLGDPTGRIRTTAGDKRVTRVGAILRRLSLDELPQVFNVLLGDMSIVGPRAHPIQMRVLDRLYQDAVSNYAARHRVKPGITGLAQVNGLRGEVDTLEKARRRVELDLHYIDNYSVWLDLMIIIKTFTAGLWSRNAY